MNQGPNAYQVAMDENDLLRLLYNASYRAAMDANDTDTLLRLLVERIPVPDNELNELGPWLIEKHKQYPEHTIYLRLFENFSECLYGRISSLEMAKIYRAAMREENTFVLNDLLILRNVYCMASNDALDELGPWLIEKRKQYQSSPSQSGIYQSLLEEFLSEKSSSIDQIYPPALVNIYRAAMRENDTFALEKLLDLQAAVSYASLRGNEGLIELGPWLIKNAKEMPASSAYRLLIEKLMSRILSQFPLLELVKIYRVSMKEENAFALEKLLDVQAILPRNEGLDELGPWLTKKAEEEASSTTYKDLLTKFRLLLDQMQREEAKSEEKQPEGKQPEEDQFEEDRFDEFEEDLFGKDQPEGKQLEEDQPKQVAPEQGRQTTREHSCRLSEVLGKDQDTDQKQQQKNDSSTQPGERSNNSVAGSNNFFTFSTTLFGVAVGTTLFAAGVSALAAVAVSAATFFGVKAIQAVRGWLAQRAYTDLDNAKQINHDYKLVSSFSISKATREGFKEGVKAQQSWTVYAKSPLVTYFGTVTDYGKAYQAGRHAQALKEATQANDYVFAEDQQPRKRNRNH